MQSPFPRTCGVLLREPEASDVAPLADIEFDPDVKRYSAVPKKSRAEWIATFTRDLGKHRCLTVLALPKLVVAGRASIARDGPYNRELIVFIGKTFWGRGMGRLVAYGLIRVAFKEYRAKAVVATVHPENKAALDLLRSYGFEQTGVKSMQGDRAGQNGHLEYRLSACV